MEWKLTFPLALVRDFCVPQSQKARQTDASYAARGGNWRLYSQMYILVCVLNKYRA